MDKDALKLLVKYNKEAHQQMNNIVKSLSEEEWNK
jgi:uncharacterized protein YprB with RNaseH-like and TPR domain